MKCEITARTNSAQIGLVINNPVGEFVIRLIRVVRCTDLQRYFEPFFLVTLKQAFRLYKY